MSTGYVVFGIPGQWPQGDVYEEYAEVYVQNIIYQKRDLSRILSERYTDLDESDWKTTNPVFQNYS